MTKAHVGAGDVRIELDGQTETLRPTIAAIRELSRVAGSGGLPALIQSCGGVDLDAIVSVVAAGIGKPVSESLREQAFAVGANNLAPKCCEYLVNLMCGGKPPSDEPSQEINPDEVLSTEDFLSELEKKAMGWLGWTEAVTQTTDINAIVIAIEGRMEMLSAIFGGDKDSKGKPKPTVSKRKVTPALFDALFGGKSKAKPKGK